MAVATEVAPIQSTPSVQPGLHRNLFSIHGTELPPNVLLMAKLVVGTFLVGHQLPASDPYLPFLTLFDGLMPHTIFHLLVAAAFVCAGLGVLFNICVRTSCLVAGSAILVSILASKPFYHNNTLYGALLLILAGLCESRAGCWILRLQVAILYFGAALNKLLEADWRSGQFFQHWFGEIHNHGWFLQVGAVIPHFAQAVSWSIILLEFAFVPVLLYRRTVPLAVWTVIAYHTAILVVMNSTFQVFYYLIAACMLAFADWPQLPFTIRFASEDVRRLAAKFRRWIDPDGAFVVRSASSDEPRLSLETENTNEVGLIAALRALLLWPPTYFLLLLLLKLPEPVLHMRRPIAITAVLLFAPLAVRTTARNFRLRA